jgi:hypothetical protein
MGASFIGRAAVFGVTASLGATMSPANCIGSLMIQSFSIKSDAVVARYKVGSSTVGQSTADKSYVVNIKGIFTGTGLTDAVTQASRMPQKGDVISIADSTDPQVVGNYVIDDSEKTTDVNEPKMLTITAVRFLDNDITAAVAA